jgi:hypothetical protein
LANLPRHLDLPNLPSLCNGVTAQALAHGLALAQRARVLI